ncbi:MULTISPECIES: hypothetical protein [unclassified Acidovorax]|uniref:hypothetical protein n=1 Tax=unclassified Acidovorax TaxID=2684926 RepID=UPI000A95CD8D|nr:MULTISPECIES: hypothetical protein [unclassified Acidovorax]
MNKKSRNVLVAVSTGACMASSAVASSPDMAAIAYMLGFQVICLVWPLLLPTFFLGSYTSKSKPYLILIGLAYAIMGFVHLPFSLFGLATLALGLEVPFLEIVLLFGDQIVALVLSVLGLRRYGRRLVSACLNQGFHVA